MLCHEFVTAQLIEIVDGVTYKSIAKDNCVKISDSVILNNYALLTGFKSHWGHWGNVRDGLNYDGISIISSEEIDRFRSCIFSIRTHRRDVKKLIKLCKYAKENDLVIVHYGI
jgi:hypothetical protein